MAYSDQIRSSPQFIRYKTDFDKTIGDFKDNINDIVQKGAKIDTNELLTQATHLISGTSNTSDFFNMLHNMRQYDDLTFAHCMNVALISNILATWLHLPQDKVETATLCGLLHDIGKLAIPDQIIKKPGKLTDAEYKTIKTHTIEGYNILKNQDISEHVKNAALMHHEKCDGANDKNRQKRQQNTFDYISCHILRSFPKMNFFNRFYNYNVFFSKGQC